MAKLILLSGLGCFNDALRSLSYRPLTNHAVAPLEINGGVTLSGVEGLP